MADRPILFSAPMVRALIDGRKTQTRRVLKRPIDHFHASLTEAIIDGTGQLCWWNGRDKDSRRGYQPPFMPNDRLWVREACATWTGDLRDAAYRADETDEEWANLRHDATLGFWKLRPSIHMPRWASRLTLIVTDVRVQRLREISEADARAEGICADFAVTDAHNHWVDLGDGDLITGWDAREVYASLWNYIHAPGAWAANPWVVALTFTVHRCNIDQMPGAANA